MLDQVLKKISSFLKIHDLKGTVRVIPSDPSCKDNNVRFTTVPLKP